MITVDFERLCVAPGDRILDVGCGSGRHTCEAYRLPRVLVVGADVAIMDLKEAGRRLEYHHRLGEHGRGAWALAAADATALPWKNGAFHAVICSEVLEHIPDHSRAVRELIRVLKPGGQLAVSVPRFFPEKLCWALSPAYRSSSGGHIRIYRSRQLIRMIEAAGARHLARHYAHSLHTPYWWLKCLLGAQNEAILPVRLYHRFLTWEIMQKPRAVKWIDRLLNPVLGKSVVMYFQKASAKCEAT